MKNLLISFGLLLSLTLAVCAEDWVHYKDPSGHFRLDFPGKVKKEKESDGIALEATDRSGQSLVGLVIFGKGYTRWEMFKLLTDKTGGDTQNFTRKECSLSGHPALEISGISRDGVPIGALLVGGKERSYILIARSFDLAFQRQALQSFRLK